MAKHMYSSGNLKLFAAIIGECIVISCCDVCYLQSFCDDSRYHVSSSVSSDSSRQCEGVARDIVELHCSFYNDTPPADNAATYQWWRNNVLLNISSATIKYPQFDPHDGGKYQCESYDTSGSRVLCGQVELTTLPFPLDNLPPRHDGNCQYHDYVRGQYVCVENGSCQLVIPALVGGYPTPNITWYIDDHQATITVMNNKSAAILDIQLWSHLQKPTGVLLEAQNKLGNIKICTNLSPKSSNRGVGPVPFSNSITPHKLHKGDTDAVVKTCSPDTYIGDFYICYSNNMSDLAGLDVNDEHCCYCSDVGAQNCKVKMPNWRLKYTDSTCRLYLRRVTMSDVGFYQCRVFNIDYYPCKYRYGNLISVSVDDWISEHVTIFLLIVVVAVLFSVVIISGTSYLICQKYRKQSYRELDQTHKSEEQYPVTENSNHFPKYGATDCRLPVGTSVNSASVNSQQQSPIFSSYNWSTNTNRSVKVHMLSDGTKQSEDWINDTLMPMLDNLNVTVEYNIAGRPWIMEISRLIKTGCKIIVVITKGSQQLDWSSNQFSNKFVQALSQQNIFDPVVIPVLLNCKLTDLQDSIQQLLSNYIWLRDNEVNVDRLQQSLFYSVTDIHPV